MSGGVDSAVALLRAGPGAVGVTLRLWIDPQGPDSERACCSPSGGARRARGLPPRAGCRTSRSTCGEEFRRGDRDAVRARLCARRDAEPVRPLQRQLPLRASCSRSRGASAPSGSRPATTRASSSATGRSLLARAVDERRTRATCSPGSTRACSSAIWFPLGEQTKEETRAEAAARRARRPPAGPESQEACFLARRRLPAVPRAARRSSRATGRSPTSAGTCSGRTGGYWAFTPGQRRGLGVAAVRAALRARHRAADEHRRRRSATRRLRGRTSPRAAACYVPVRPRRGEASLPLARRSRPTVERDRRAASSCSLDEPAFGVARGPGGGAVRRTTWWSVPAWSPPRRSSRLRRRCSRSPQATRRTSRSPSFSLAVGLAARVGAPPARGRPSTASRRCSRGTERELIPVVTQAGRLGRPRERAARQARPGDRQRRRRGRRGRPGGADGQLRDHAAGPEADRPDGGRDARVVPRCARGATGGRRSPRGGRLRRAASATSRRS